MTNHEAIQFLKNMQGEENGRAIGAEGFYAELCGYHVQALGMAIMALSEQRTGHWITVTNGRGGNECSLCHVYAPSYQNGDEWLTKYCPNCGAKMVEPHESDHKCHTCKHYTSGEDDGSCGSYICKGYSNWESEE